MLIYLTEKSGKTHSIQVWSFEVTPNKIYSAEDLLSIAQSGEGSVMPQDKHLFDGKVFMQDEYPAGTPNHPNFRNTRVYMKEI